MRRDEEGNRGFELTGVTPYLYRSLHDLVRIAEKERRKVSYPRIFYPYRQLGRLALRSYSRVVI